jgi:large subunit ribosomal protein L31e
MAKKKIIKKKKATEEVVEPKKKSTKKKSTKKKASKKKKVEAVEEIPFDADKTTDVPDEDIDSFDFDTVPTGDDELSEVEQEIKKDEDEFEEEIQEERFYSVPLAKSGYMKSPRWKRAKKAITVLRAFLTQHMKPEGDVYIAQELNERVWENGIKHPPRKLRVRVTKSVDGIVRAYLA